MAAIDQHVEETHAAKESWLATVGYFIRRYPLGAAGAVIVAMFVLMAIFAPWITQFDPTLTNSRVSLARPGGDRPRRTACPPGHRHAAARRALLIKIATRAGSR